MKKQKITILTNKDPEFYNLLGPFLANKEVSKEIAGGSYYTDGIIWDDDGKQWFVIIDKGKVVAFGTLVKQSKYMIFAEDYVRPEYRNNGLHQELIKERLALCKDISAKVVANTASSKNYKECGFKVKRQRGKFFVEMVKE